MIAFIKGYNVTEITKNKLSKGELFEELKQIEPEIISQITESLDNNGFVIGLKKKKILKAVYLFNQDTQPKELVFTKSIKTSDVVEKTIKDFEEAIIEELKEKVALEEISKVNWNDIEIEPKKFSWKWLSGTMFAFWLAMGLILGIVIDDLSFGLCIGICLGLSLGVVVKKKKDI